MKRKFPRRQGKKFRHKMEGCDALATSKAPDGKTPSTFAMYVDDKLKQMDTCSRALTEKRIIDILFVQAQYSNGMPPVQAQYSSGTPQTQNFWMGLLKQDSIHNFHKCLISGRFQHFSHCQCTCPSFTK